MKQVRVIVVVNWHTRRVHGITADDEEARRWCRELVAKYNGDPLAATMTVDVIEVPQDRMWDA